MDRQVRDALAGSCSRAARHGRLAGSAWRCSTKSSGSSCSHCGTCTRSSSRTRTRAGSTRSTARMPVAQRPLLDRWVLSQLSRTEAAARDGLEAYDATGAGRRIADFVDDLSNWYVRRARRRFWDPAGEGGRRPRGLPHAARVPRQPLAAARALHTVRGGDPVAQPGRRTRRRAGLRASVGLPDAGRAPGRTSLDDAMAAVRQVVEPRATSPDRDQGARAQPLLEAVVHYAATTRPSSRCSICRRRGAEREAGAVRGVRRATRPVARQAELQGPRPSARTRVKVVAAALERDDGSLAAALAHGDPVRVDLGTEQVALGPSDVDLVQESVEGWGSRATAASPSRSSSS